MLFYLALFLPTLLAYGSEVKVARTSLAKKLKASKVVKSWEEKNSKFRTLDTVHPGWIYEVAYTGTECDKNEILTYWGSATNLCYYDPNSGTSTRITCNNNKGYWYNQAQQEQFNSEDCNPSTSLGQDRLPLNKCLNNAPNDDYYHALHDDYLEESADHDVVAQLFCTRDSEVPVPDNFVVQRLSINEQCDDFFNFDAYENQRCYDVSGGSSFMYDYPHQNWFNAPSCDNATFSQSPMTNECDGSGGYSRVDTLASYGSNTDGNHDYGDNEISGFVIGGFFAFVIAMIVIFIYVCYIFPQAKLNAANNESGNYELAPTQA